MPMIEIKSEPSVTELRVFAALWLAFWVIIGRIVIPAGDGLLVAAGVTGGCFALSRLLNRDVRGRERWWGASFPLGLVVLWLLGRSASGGGSIALLVWLACALVGVAGAAVAFASRARATALYRAWMLAALPIGWVLSHALMLTVFYGVVTPIGLAMRAAGRDPMTRWFDKAAPGYWVNHEQTREPKRYFKQS